MRNFIYDFKFNQFIPFVTQESAIGREIAAKNRLRQSGLVSGNTTHFAAIDFWRFEPVQ